MCYQHQEAQSASATNDTRARPRVQQGADHGRRRPSRRRVATREVAESTTTSSKEALEIALSVIDDGWLVAVDELIAKQAARALWEQVKRHDRESGLCAQLNSAAEQIEGLLPTAATAAVRGLGADSMVQDFVSVLVERTSTATVDAPLIALARRIRFAGIYLCAMSGRLATCPSLRALAEPLTEDALESLLISATTDTL